MKFIWQKQLSLVVVIAILVSMLPVYALAAEGENEPELIDVTIDYVKSEDYSTLFNSSFRNFLKNPQVYTADGKDILRIEVTTQFSLEFKVGVAVNSLNAGTVVGTIGPEGSPTFTIRDYELPANYKTEYAYSTVTYTAPMGGGNVHHGNHAQYLVFDSEVTAEDRTAAKSAVDTATAIQGRSDTLEEALTAAKALNLKEHSFEEYQARTEALKAVTVVNNQIAYEDLELYGKALIAAKTVTTKDIALTNAITQAEKEVREGNENLGQEDLTELTAYLNNLVTINADVLANLDSVTIDYVKSEDYSTLFNSSFQNFLKNPQVYTADGKDFLRVEVTTQYSLEYKVGVKDSLDAGTVVGTIGPEGSPTFTIRDYELPANYKTEYAYSTVTYAAPMGGGSVHYGNHAQYLVFDSQVSTEDRAAAKSAVDTATAIQERSVTLEEAITAAKALNLIEHSSEEYQARTEALKALTVVNNQIAYEDLELYSKALNAAKAIRTKSPELIAFLALIEEDKEVKEGNEALTSARLSELTIRLNELVGLSNAKVITVDYVKTSNLNALNNNDLQNVITKTETFTANDKVYVRLHFNPKDDLTFTVTDTDVNVSRTENAVIYDFVVFNLLDPVKSKISFNVDNDTFTYEQFLVINQDATEIEREALKTLISTADAVTKKSTALKNALEEAKAVNNLLTRKADLEAARQALKTALDNNNNGNVPAPAEINEATGLEVGKYNVPVRILKNGTTEDSTMNQYVQADARLNIEKNRVTVYLLLSNSSMIQKFTVGSSNASRANYYKEEDITRYSFTVKNLTDVAEGDIHVIATLPDGSELYNMTHDIQLAFGDPYKVDKWEDEGYGSSNPGPVPGDTGAGEETNTENEENGNNNNNGGTTTPKPEVKFNDVENSWAKANIERAVALQIVTGYADGSFKPNQVVNRAEFTTMITRALKLEGEVSSLQFSDNDKIGEWAKQAIQLAIAAGIISGYEDQSFRPTNNISRAEVAVMMIKALGVEPEENYELTFADADKIPAYAKKYVAAAVKLGLIAGVGNNEFAPTKAATRAEAVTFNLRVIDYLAKK